MNTTEEEVEFDYQGYMKDYTPDPDKIHWGPEARQKRREAAIHNNRANTYAEKGDYDRAIEGYTEAIQLNPDYVYAYYNRGSVYREKEDYDRAIEDFTTAIDLKPDLVEAYYNRGVAYYERREFAQSIEDYSKTIDLKPESCRSLLQSWGGVVTSRRMGKSQIRPDSCQKHGDKSHHCV